MNETINLLDPNKDNNSAKSLKRLQLMRFFAIGMLFIVSASSIILFMLVSLSPLPELQRQEQALRLNLSESSEEMAKMALLAERTSAIESLLTKRTSYDQILSLLEERLSANAAITSIRVEQETLVVTIESRSLASLDTFLNGVIALVQEQKTFSQVTLSSLSSDNVRNEYSMTVRLVML